MAGKSFKEWLDEKKFSETLQAQTKFTDAIAAIDEIVQTIQSDVPHKDIIVTLLVGFPTNTGQQYIVALKTTGDRTPLIKLFRIYVALDGSTVTFDFYDEKPTVVEANRDAIFEAVGNFMLRPATIAQFQQLKDFLDRFGK